MSRIFFNEFVPELYQDPKPYVAIIYNKKLI